MERSWIEVPVPCCRTILCKNRFHLLTPSSKSLPHPWQPQACSLCLQVCSSFIDMFFLDSTDGRYHMKIVFLFLSTSLNMIIPRPSMLLQMALFLFFFLSGIPFSVCISISILFIHSSGDGHLGCSYVLAIVRFAAMNTGVHESFQVIVLFQIYAGDWNCWIIWKLLLVFWVTSILISTVVVAVSTPPTV